MLYLYKNHIKTIYRYYRPLSVPQRAQGDDWVQTRLQDVVAPTTERGALKRIPRRGLV